MKVDKSKSGYRATLEDRASMYQVYSRRSSLRDVVNELGFHIKTAKRWRKIDKWDERIAKLAEKMAEKEDKQVLNRRLRNVQLLDKAIENVANTFRLYGDDGTPLVAVKDLPRLVLAQEALIARGAADEPELSITDEERRALELLGSLDENTLRNLGTLVEMHIATTPINTPLLASSSVVTGSDIPTVDIGNDYEPELKNTDTKKKMRKAV